MAFVCFVFVLYHNEKKVIGRTELILIQHRQRKRIDDWKSLLIIQVNGFPPLCFIDVAACVEGVCLCSHSGIFTIVPVFIIIY